MSASLETSAVMTAKRLKIGLIQMRYEKLAVEANLVQIERHIAEAADRGVDIIGFPEMTIVGYADPIRQPAAIMRLDGPEVGRCVQFTTGRSIKALIGMIEESPTGKPSITQKELAYLAARPSHG
jgi:predicted amidohydrolase